MDAAIEGLTRPGPVATAAEFTGILGLVTACGELGRVDTIREFVDRGYHLARATPYTPTTRFVLSLRHVVALTLAGLLEEALEVSRRVEQEPMEFPLALACAADVSGIVATAASELATAQRLLGEAVATAQSVEQQWLRSSIQLDLGIALAIAGRRHEARAAVDTVHADDPIRRSFEFADVAEAWVRAASGPTAEAVSIVRGAARRARTIGGSAREVYCLQIAAQFGDASGSDRLAELVTVVEGPRAVAAAAHAAALRDADVDGLLAAARRYDSFGDRVAAGDAAAQAAVVFRGLERRGAALTATAFARRLADETGADTPALRANNSPIPLTGRQREIIALAAQGLSNREIAERLTMSVRTVEGHLFRACQRTGVNSRQTSSHWSKADEGRSATFRAHRTARARRRGGSSLQSTDTSRRGQERNVIADWRTLNLANWESRVPVHTGVGGYDLSAFDDPNHLSAVVRYDLPRLGRLDGLDVAHLQCHIGTDTVSLARLGTRSTVGLDFSPSALAAARELATRAAANVAFVEGDLYDALALLGTHRFDVVYTGIGAICWLPSIQRWADVVAGLLRPGGRLFMREGHPVLWSLSDPRPDGLLVLEYPYFESEGVLFTDDTTYAGTAPLTAPHCVCFNHGLGEIFTALTEAGLTVTAFEEHREVPWNPFGQAMMPSPEFPGEFVLAAGRDRVPLTYTLQARSRTP